MDSKFTRLMDLCLEIEGLISLAGSRRNAAPGRLYDLLQLKASSLLDEVRALGAEVPPVPVDEADEVAEADEQATVASADLEQKEDATDTAADNLAVELNPVPAADDMADVDVDIPQTAEVHDLADEIEPAVGPSEAPRPADVPESVTTLADTIEAPSSRNEALLSGEFSLNDKFRFRRSLFSNNDREMAEALAVADSMNSVSDLEDYFYNDLCWDAQNPEVIDFMRILTRRLEK